MPRCNLCEEVKPFEEFHTRYTRYGKTIHQPYCKKCKGTWNSMRAWKDGKQVAPSIEAVRAVVQGGQATPAARAVLKSAGHERTKPKRPRVPMSEREKRARQIVREETEKRRKKQGSRGYIYLIGEQAPRNQPQLTAMFAHAIVNYAVKIGWSADEEDRIKGLQTSNPRPLVVLATREGTEDEEHALHAKYVKDNVLQEWFRPTREVLSEFGLRAAIFGRDRIYLEENK